MDRLRWIFLVLIALYASSHYVWFSRTSLGMTPVLDGAENISLAEKIYQKKLPKEPFYRAMLYPFFLSIFRYLGADKSQLQFIASISGLIFHVLNSLLVAWLAMFMWKSEKSFLVGLLLYGLYPLAIYFAVDPLDITLAITFTLLAMNLFLFSIQKESLVIAIFAGIALGLGIFTRPNMLLMILVLIFGLLIAKIRKQAILTICSCAIILFFGGLINYSRSGEFRVLPWQGAFNLYVANNGNANGKYFSQTILLPDRKVGENPARMESEILYMKLSKNESDFSISKFNSFWRKKTFAEISSNPLKWLKLELKKLYYIFNNFEQYNNKTFIFHKQLSPILRYNPLCWGITLILGFIVLFNVKDFSLSLKLSLAAIVSLSIGLLIFFVSARFRFLLLPFIIAIASGIADSKKLFQVKNLVVLLLVSMITFTGFFKANNTSTFVSDYLLMAHSNARIFNYTEQLKWAEKVLSIDSENVDAMKIQLNAFLNLVLNQTITDEKEWKRIVPSINYLDSRKMVFTDTAFLLGCYAWKFERDDKKAWKLWEEGLHKFEPKSIYAAMLLLTNNFQGADFTEVNPLLWYALVKSKQIKSADNAKFERMKEIVDFLLKQTSK